MNSTNDRFGACSVFRRVANFTTNTENERDSTSKRSRVNPQPFILYMTQNPSCSGPVPNVRPPNLDHLELIR